MAKRAFTINLDEEIIDKIKKLAKVNDMKSSELVNRVLKNFVGSFDVLKKDGKTKDVIETDDDKYVEYYETLRKLLSNDDISKDKKDFLVG
jgi:metal-responsive CopG/Arc/MetJ family transcriptional regulator